jgi:hypothetical protein
LCTPDSFKMSYIIKRKVQLDNLWGDSHTL